MKQTSKLKQNRRKNMKKLVALSLVLIMLFSLAACGQKTPTSSAAPSAAPSEEGPTSGGTIAIPINDDPTTLLGWKLRNSNEQVIQPIIYEFLMKYDATGKPQPYLLESAVENPEELTYTLVVRDGITFQDGTVLDAEAVKWNLDNYKEKGVLSASYFSKVDNVEVKDSKTVVVHMTEWDSQFLYGLARICAICSPTAVKELGEEGFNEKPVGTGPFMVKEWKHGEGIYTVRYDNYWQGKPYLDGVNILKYATTATQQAALQAGDLDVMYLSGDPTTAEALAAKGFTVVNSIIPQTAYTICFNSLADSPLKDLRVRQAIAYAIDAKGIADALLGNGKYGEASTQWALPGSSQYADIPGYAFDVEKAKSLMKEAGYENGFELTINYQVGDFARNACQIIAQQLSEIGITLKLNEIEVANYANYLGEWDGLLFHPMGVVNGQFSQISANMIVGALFGSKAFLHDDKSITLINEAIKADEATAEAKLKEVVKILFQDNLELYTIAIAKSTAVINPKLMDSGLSEIVPYYGTLWKAYLVK